MLWWTSFWITILILVYVSPFVPGPLLCLRALWRILARLPPAAPPSRRLNGVSVVVPARNEASGVVLSLRRLQSASRGSLPVEVLLVDGGSSDGTPEAVEAAKLPRVSVLRYSGEQGRGGAIKLGVSRAKYDAILMVHADMKLPDGWDVRLEERLAAGDTVLTFFAFGVNLEDDDIPEGVAAKLRSTAMTVNLRSRYLWLPYGDQALAIRKEMLEELGGVPDIPLMEDFVLVCRARAHALRRGLRLRCVDGPAALCSPRRWLKLKVWKVTIINWVVSFAHMILRVPPATLAGWYYGKH